MIYEYASGNSKQALLVHRPRLASLRSRTRLDRSRPLASDITGEKHDAALSTSRELHRNSKPKTKKGPMPRETNRPYFGLTQVSKLIRYEYRPIYLQHQEIGMDLTRIVEYLRTFYFDAPDQLTSIDAPGKRESDLPFGGNLTIAIDDNPTKMDRSQEGIEIFPLLDIWANSFKFEAGFGRYMKVGYIPGHDGEAKDL